MYEMFTDEGNDAVARALAAIALVAQDRTRVWNRETLETVAIPVLRAVSVKYEEIYDTEPRGNIADFLDQLCAENGWAFDPYAGYEW
jgi:hypothetical protein